MDLTKKALVMLRNHPDYIEDAREGSVVDNSVIGSILCIILHYPRWATEKAVREALDILDKEDETDPENIYGSASIRQSIEDDRR
jgi:hypothetical protein